MCRTRDTYGTEALKDTAADITIEELAKAKACLLEALPGPSKDEESANFAAVGLSILGIVTEWRIKDRDNRILSEIGFTIE